MTSLLSQITAFLPIFLASPTMYAGMVLIMSSTRHTRLRVFAALVGCVLAVIVIGVLAVGAGGAATDPKEPTSLSGIINLILGFALILLSVRVLMKKSKSGKVKKTRPVEDASARPKLVKFAGYGILLVVTNPTSLTAYLASAKLTVDSGLEATQQLIAMSVAALYFSLPILIPLILLLVAPTVCRKFLNLAERILDKYGRYIIAVLLVIVGLNMIQRGLDILR
ncbi:MAG: GAP family protein [Thermoleophilia bacterium]|jgi:threonine/homoserine/homoserine lactone efflux protein